MLQIFAAGLLMRSGIQMGWRLYEKAAMYRVLLLDRLGRRGWKSGARRLLRLLAAAGHMVRERG